MHAAHVTVFKIIGTGRLVTSFPFYHKGFRISQLISLLIENSLFHEATSENNRTVKKLWEPNMGFQTLSCTFRIQKVVEGLKLQQG